MYYKGRLGTLIITVVNIMPGLRLLGVVLVLSYVGHCPQISADDVKFMPD